MKIKDLKQGDFFTLKEIAEPNERQVYIRGEYDRGSKTYECTRFDDISNTRFFKGDKVVYTEFTF